LLFVPHYETVYIHIKIVDPEYPQPIECDRKLRITETEISYDGCRDPDISLILNNDNQKYPIKGVHRDARGTDYYLYRK
jgi:hypothetical protein